MFLKLGITILRILSWKDVFKNDLLIESSLIYCSDRNCFNYDFSWV